MKPYVLACGLLLAAFKLNAAPPEMDAPSALPRLLEFTASVEYVDVEGGFYALRADDGNNYVPLNLDPMFLQDGLRLRLSAEMRPGMRGIHQYGSYIRVLVVMPSNCHDINVLHRE